MAQTILFKLDLGKYGGSLIVNAGFDNSLSHNGVFYYSLDFAAEKKGDTIYALSSGIVKDLRSIVPDGANAGGERGDLSRGPSGIGNFLTQTSGSGYLSYLHMEQGSVVPSSGKPITAGDIVGDVGLTGFRTGLHFHVQFGSQTVRLNNDGLGPNSTVADASLSGPRPVFETATGEIIRGIVSQVSYDISTKSLGTGQHNLTLLGTLSINGTGDKYDNTISGNLGNNRLSGLDGNDKIYGGDGNDSISGGTGNDTLDGGANNDTLSGDAGNDKMYGQLGNDSISGGTDRDTIDGGAGNDTINGGAGQDFVTGGAGADVFVIASAGDSRAGAGDTIFDFFSAGATQYPGSPAGDRIRVSSIDFDSTKSGFQNPTLIGNQPFHGVAGEMRLSNGLVQVDFDGDKRADFEIKIPGMTSLKASDWIFD